MRKGLPRRNGHYVRSRGRTECYYCRCSFDWDNPASDYYPTREHKHPRSKGGTNHPGNVVLACHRCNQEKGAMTVTEFREYLEVTKGCAGLLMRRMRWQKYVGNRASQHNAPAATSEDK